MKKYYSVKEASKLLNVSTNTIYKYVKEGKLSTRRIGKGRIKILYQELLPYVERPEEGIFSEEKKTEAFTTLNKKVSDDKTSEVKENRTDEEFCKLKLSDDELTYGQNDRIFYRLYKSLFLLSLGILYLLVNAFSNISQSNALISSVLIISGTISLAGVFKRNIPKILDVPMHIVQMGIFSFLTYHSLGSKNYLMIIFIVPFLVIALNHCISILGRSEKRSTTFGELLSRYLLTLFVGLGVIMLTGVSLGNFETSLLALIPNIKYILLILYSILLYILIYLQTPRGKMSNFTSSAYLLISVVVGVYAFLNTRSTYFDVILSTYLLSVFTLFLFVWSSFAIKMERSKIPVLAVILIWIASTILFGLFTVGSHIESEKKYLLQEVNNKAKELAAGLNQGFEKQSVTALRYSGDVELRSLILRRDTQKATEKAREIYEKLDSVSRVVLYDSQGIALGVYPRNPIIQGTNFSDREYFQETLKTYRSRLSPAMHSIVGVVGMMRTEPVFDSSNDLIGVIGIGTDLEALSEDIQKRVGDDTRVTAVGMKGEYVLHWDQELLGHTALVQGIETSEGDGDVSFVNKDVENLGWKIYLEVPLSSLQDMPTGLSRVVSLLIFVNSALSIFIGLMIVSKQRITIFAKRGTKLNSRKKLNVSVQ